MYLFNNTKPGRQTVKGDNRKDKPAFSGLPDRKTSQRFVFHMGKCIGCHTCEVACSEQNNLPADTAWRRVGEVEGGIFPDVKRYFVSLSCNHCLDAPCLKGCPADAYYVNKRGLVIHNDPACIGCGYCTWNCPYGVPTFQKDRKIVTKCDMCSNRLDQGLQPACVEACPAGAIETEEVDIKKIIKDYVNDATAPAMPSPEMSIPSTKIVLPGTMNPDEFTKTNNNIIRPEAPHYSLIFMTVFTQLSVGGFLLAFITDLMRTFMTIPDEVFRSVSYLAPVLFGIAGLSLTSSVFHLGRPAYFYRAFKRWKTSWLSREAIGLGLFSILAFAYSIMLFASGAFPEFSLTGKIPSWTYHFVRIPTGLLTVSLGIYGIYASSRIYRVPSRPSWNSLKTTLDFFIVSLLCGTALFMHAASIATIMYQNNSFLDNVIKLFSAIVIITGSFTVFFETWVKRKRGESPVTELVKSNFLLENTYYRENAGRYIFLGTATLILFMIMVEYTRAGSVEFALLTMAALLLYTLYSLTSRYLFFVTVIASNIPGNFIIEVNKPERGQHD